MGLFNKKNKIKIIIFFSFIFLHTLYLLYKSDKNNIKIEKFNIHLEGKIIDKQKFKYGHDYGFVLIDVKSSNYFNYTSNSCLFKIKDKKGILMIPTISVVENGDSIVIDKSLYTIFRNNKILKSNKLLLLNRIFCDKPKWDINTK